MKKIVLTGLAGMVMTFILGAFYGFDDFFFGCVIAISILVILKLHPKEYKEKGRQIVHLCYGIFIIYMILIFGLVDTFGISLFIFMILLYLTEISEGGKHIPFIRHGLRHFERNDVEDFKGVMHYTLGVMITIFLFGILPIYMGYQPYESAVLAAILVLAFGDSFSTAFGIIFGEMKIAKNRTAEGSFAGLIAAFLICKTLVIPQMALIAAVIGTLVDWLNLPIDDNLTIPLFVAIALL